MKYGEQELIDELAAYIKSTYGEHYVSPDGIQVQDLFHSIDIAAPFCQANAIKYLVRFGKKSGKNRKDLLKALHYIILLMHFSEEDQIGPASISEDSWEAYRRSLLEKHPLESIEIDVEEEEEEPKATRGHFQV